MCVRQPWSTRRFRNSVFAALVVLLGCAILLPAVTPAVPADAPSESESVRVPIVMYHLILRDPARAGNYVISPETLEADLKFLKENGYQTVTAEDLIAFVYEGDPLPEKPVVLTFDDSYTNNYTYAYPLLEQYGMRAVLSVIGSVTDRYTASNDENPNYANLTWARVRELSDSGVFEIQNHTYDLHRNDSPRKGCKRILGESVESYQAMLSRDLLENQSAIERAIGTRPRAFVYPFGAISPESVEVVKNAGFLASFSCEEGMNELRFGDPDGLFLLKRKNRPAGISSDDFFAFLTEPPQGA